MISACEANEQDALLQRVQQVLASSPFQTELAELARAVRSSWAVVNVTAAYARLFIESETSLYATYEKLVAANGRLPAAAAHDHQRSAIGGLLFGSYASEMRYAALSLDGSGLMSYGPITLVLRPVAVSTRASVLEENSYFFVERHKIVPGSQFPSGYRAPWQTRDLVAVAKLGPRLTSATTFADFAGLLLKPGSRADDDFIEVFIYRGFNRTAIDRIRLPPPGTPNVNLLDVSLLKETARKAGIPVEVP